jgi:hypothetical protein
MMPQSLVRWAILVGVVVLTLAGFGLARASVGELAALRLVPSAAPTLLGPILESGRTGWECAPERAASAVHVRAAELPDDAGP